MAGGDVNVVRSAFPMGDTSIVVLHSANITIAGAVSAQKVWEETCPFHCKCVKTEFTAKVFTDADAGNDVTVTVQDDTATPKKFVNAAPLGASWAAGSQVVRSLTVDKNVEFFADSLIRLLITSEASDVITDGRITLWLKPVH